MHHIISYLCMIIKCKDPRILTYNTRVQFMWDLKSKSMPGKSVLDHYLSVTFITAGMLLYDCGPWPLLLSLPDMSLFKISIHYVDSSIDTGYYST